MSQQPKSLRFFDNLPPGATVLMWRGHMFVIWPQDYQPPPAVEMKAIPHHGTVA